MIEKTVVYLKNRDWHFERLEESVVATGFTIELEDGRDHGFTLYIMQVEDAYEGQYIRLTIVPFIDQPYDGYPYELHLALGQINHDLPVMRFAFDADGDLEMILDLPVEYLSEEEFDRSLQLLVDYAGEYYLVLNPLVDK